MEPRRISADELAQKLANSKKIMRKVDTGDYNKGYVNEDLIKEKSDNIEMEDEQKTPQQKPFAPINKEKIMESKLPDNIKRAMIDNPIPQITLNDSLDMDFVKKAKKIMENEGLSTTQTKKTTKDYNQTTQINENKLETLIENAVRKVLDEKLNQILTAQQLATINENLVLKVGDSIFKGKITGVQSSKSK